VSDPTLGFVALGVVFVGVLSGFPMAFAFLFIALAFGYAGIQEQAFYLLTYQFFALMRDTTLAAIPLFLFMGYVLEQSGLMERMFLALRLIFPSVRGSLYLIVLLVATVFAAATGIVGASVTVLGVMAAPVMKSSNYNTRLSAGTIAAGGTLGILIPPSVMLIVMGPVMGVPVSDLFAGAIVPGLLLSAVYIVYTLTRSALNPTLGPPLPHGERERAAKKLYELLVGVIPVAIIVTATLGVIIAGITSPTDAAGTGAFAALALSLLYRRMTWSQLKQAVFRTMETTAFIMLLIASANFFGAVFARLGSAAALTNALLQLPLSAAAMLAVILGIVFLLGGPLEWIPIVLVVVPIFLPAVTKLGFDLLWFSILVAVTLQTSWLTPPMALSAYFLKGVVPDWSMGDIYVGMIPFVFLQLLVVVLLCLFPRLILWLPGIIG
jgi:tripartite ATP-independent transporter DctM subunit